jgi:hypothetical protein
MGSRCVLQTEYANPQELWERSKDDKGSHETWYKGAVEYWDKQEASYNGVLGGFECVSDPDINDSRQLLVKVRFISKCSHTYSAGLSTQCAVLASSQESREASIAWFHIQYLPIISNMLMCVAAVILLLRR